MRQVLFLAPTKREYRSVPKIAEKLNINVIWDDFAGDYFDDFLQVEAFKHNTLDIVELIENTIDAHKHENLAGVTTAVGYPGMPAIAVIAERLGLPGPNPEVILRCEHKYYSRMEQRRLVPEATPKFWLIDPRNASSLAQVENYPAFVKPVKSCMSMNAYRIESREELEEKAAEAPMPERFNKPYDDMAKTYTDLDLSCSFLIVEELLQGKQVSLEGYVYRGRPVVMGIVDGEMVEGTLSFTRWVYPSRLPENVQARMRNIAEKFFAGCGYDNAMFNMELMWNPQTDAIHIIEVNPKIASQFPDLFEKVDAINGYEVLLKLCLGEDPKFEHGKGQFKIAASCVLRSFENVRVVRTPKAEDISAVQSKYPDALVTVIATEGRLLSEQSQDTSSFRYGLINIGAQSISELEAKNDECKQLLKYEFADPASEDAEETAHTTQPPANSNAID